MAGKSQRRFEFGWLEVIGLVLVFSIGATAVFLLGIFVGKGLQEQRIRREDRTVRLTIDGLTTGTAAIVDDVQLLGQLGGPQASPGIELQVRAIPSPTSVQPIASPGTSPTPFRAPAATPTMRTALPTARPSPLPTASVVDAVTGGDQGRWSVQVNATRDPMVARQLVGSLRAKGYRAYEVRVRLQGETWFRVRVGRFGTMEDATGTVVRLKGRDGFTRAFLVEE